MKAYLRRKHKRKNNSFILLVCISIGTVVFGILFYSQKQTTTTQHNLLPVQGQKNKPVPSRIAEAQYQTIKKTSSLFVPYWALGKDDGDFSTYDKIYYFGITGNENGVVKDETGYRNLERFDCPDKKKCILVLRMLDSAKNLEILSDSKKRGQLIKDVIRTADEFSFSGIALDLEFTSLFNTDIKDNINAFVKTFYTAAKKNYKTFSFIIYGDVFYRNKPFDVSFIGQNVDEVMVMAYDLSKSYGEPGPNFNFDKKNIYGYDFQQMVSDYLATVSSDKLTIIFGMYGYDWTLNDQGTPLKRGEAVTVNSLKSKVLKSKVENSNSAKEKKIEYVDEQNRKHVVWYEDAESAQIKIDYLLKQGIGSVSYWAYSYF